MPIYYLSIDGFHLVAEYAGRRFCIMPLDALPPNLHARRRLPATSMRTTSHRCGRVGFDQRHRQVEPCDLIWELSPSLLEPCHPDGIGDVRQVSQLATREDGIDGPGVRPLAVSRTAARLR